MWFLVKAYEGKTELQIHNFATITVIIMSGTQHQST